MPRDGVVTAESECLRVPVLEGGVVTEISGCSGLVAAYVGAQGRAIRPRDRRGLGTLAAGDS